MSSQQSRRLPHRLALVVVLAFVVACQPTTAPEPGADAAALAALADELWQRQLDNVAYIRLMEGLPVEQLPDLSYEKAEEEAQFAQTVLDRLAILDEAALDHDDWLTWAVFKRNAEMTVEGFQFYWYTNVLTPYSSAIGSLRQIFQASPLLSAEMLSSCAIPPARVPTVSRRWLWRSCCSRLRQRTTACSRSLISC